MNDLEQIRIDLEEFTSLVDEEHYLNGAGLKDKAEFTRIYNRFGHLFNRDTIDFVREYSKTAEGEDERRVSYLKAFLISDYMENRVKELSDKLLTRESEATVNVDGQTLAFRHAAVVIVNEPDRYKRSSIFQARNRVIQSLNPIMEERISIFHKTSNDLGYSDYVQLYQDIKGFDLEALERILQPLLEKTLDSYLNSMGELVQQRAGVKLSEAEKHDISFTFRANQFDPSFRKEKALPTLIQTLAGMGINLEGQRNIHLDVEERPKKDPRAFVSPVKVPGDIRLVVMPQGGHDDYATLFHEAGHAEHFGSTRGDLPVEYRYLGDNSLTEGFAFLLEYLITNPHWLTKFTDMKDPKDFLKFVRLYRLYFLRRYAAKLSYELTLHRQGLECAPSRYRSIMESALVFKHPPSHYLMDVDDGFYTANYLRAWIFEAQVRRILKESFGEKWFEKKSAGIQLQKWWSLGQKFRVEEMLRDLGYKGLDIRPLLEDLQVQSQ